MLGVEQREGVGGRMEVELQEGVGGRMEVELQGVRDGPLLRKGGEGSEEGRLSEEERKAAEGDSVGRGEHSKLRRGGWRAGIRHLPY